MNLDTRKGYCAYLVTAQGTVAIRLRPAAAPRTVNNFIYLARQGYFDGATIARACPDPADPGCFGNLAEVAADSGPGYTLGREAVRGQYLLGAVAMSSDGEASSGGRFFISTGDNRSLPHTYNLFGQVTDGIELLPALKKGLVIQTVIVSEAAGSTA